MTPDERSEINRQNAQHSTGPKTDEGKAKVAQNAITHGLSSTNPPLQNPEYLEILKDFQALFPAQSSDHDIMVRELAHLAWKIKQIPSIEYEIEQNSELTLAEHFMQDKPTPLTRLWNLELRIWGRFNSLHRKLTALKTESLGAPSSSSGSRMPPLNTQKPQLQIKPTPPASSLQSPASPLQNKATSTLSTAKSTLQSLQKLAKAIQDVPLNIPNPF